MIRILSEMRRTALLLALAAVCLPPILIAAGCDEASPVAPPGTTLSLSVQPSRLAADGSATVRVTALRANGTPVNPGTQVRLETTLGSIDPIIETDASGIAEGTLRGDGRVGMATVTARTGSAEPAMVDVEIGEFAASVTLQASPSQVTAGGSVDLLAVVRDDEGRPLEGASANFLTEVGTLDSRGAVQFSNDDGQVRDRLRISVEDVEALSAPTFSVEVVVGGEGGEGGRDQVTIRVTRQAPVVQFVARPSGQNQVFFDNQTTGEEPITFEWDFQNDGIVDSMQRSPTFNYGTAGPVTARLRAFNSAGDETVACTFNVPLMNPVTCQQ